MTALSDVESSVTQRDGTSRNAGGTRTRSPTRLDAERAARPAAQFLDVLVRCTGGLRRLGDQPEVARRGHQNCGSNWILPPICKSIVVDCCDLDDESRVFPVCCAYSVEIKNLYICLDTGRRVTAKGSCRYRECARYQQRCLLCDQPQRAGVASSHDMFYPSHNIFYRLRLRRRNDFERAIASRAVPKMTYLSFVTILGPFGSNQLIAASNAICSETRTTFGCCHSHGYSPAVAPT